MPSQGLTAEQEYLNCLAGGDVAGIPALHSNDSVVDTPGTAAVGGTFGRDREDPRIVQVMPSVLGIRSHTQRLWDASEDTEAMLYYGRWR